MEGFPGPSKKKEFIPGRPEGEPYLERQLDPVGGGLLDTTVHRYRERSGAHNGPEFRLSEEEVSELLGDGLESRTTTIDTRHAAYPALVQIIRRKRENDPEQKALRQAIEDFKAGKGTPFSLSANEGAPAPSQESSEDGIELEPVAEHERWENRKHSKKNGNGKAINEQSRIESMGSDGQDPPEEPPSQNETPKQDPEPESPKVEKSAAAANTKSGSHDDGHHHESWHLPRTIAEWGWLAAATGYGIGYSLRFLWQFVLHPALHTTGYVLSGDAKHPWQTAWNNFLGALIKPFGGTGGGKAHSGGHGGH